MRGGSWVNQLDFRALILPRPHFDVRPDFHFDVRRGVVGEHPTMTESVNVVFDEPVVRVLGLDPERLKAEANAANTSCFLRFRANGCSFRIRFRLGTGGRTINLA